MSDEKPNLLLRYGPPLAVLSFLAAFWASGMVGGGGSASDGSPSLGAPTGDVVPTATETGARPRDEEAVRDVGRPVRDGDTSPSRFASSRATGAALADRAKRASERSTEREPVAGQVYPSLRVDEPEFDFGKVFEGEEVRHKFVLRNEGEAPLELSDVKTSCGCTVAEYTREPIDPGTEGFVDIVFKTKAKKGSQKKSVSIYSNDPNSNPEKLWVKGYVQPSLWVEPRERIDLGTLKIGEKIEPTELVVKWLGNLDLEITDVVVRNDAIRVTREPWSDAENGGEKLTVAIDDVAALIQQGQTSRISETIQIHTNDERFKRQFIFLSGVVEREVMIRPYALSFGVAKDDEDTQRRIQVLAAEGFSLEEPTVESPLDWVDIEVVPVEEGKRYDIVATLRAAEAPRGKFFRSHMVIRTNSTDVPELQVLVSGRLGNPPKARRPFANPKTEAERGDESGGE